MTGLRLLMRLTKNTKYYGHQVQTERYGNFKFRQELCCALPIMAADNHIDHKHQNQLQQIQCRQYSTFLNANLVKPISTNALQLCNKRDFLNHTAKRSAGKTEAKAAAAATDADLFGEASHLGLFAKFKLMYKKYWYVLIPVHVVTSIGWFGGFYYLSKSGVDIATVLHYLHVSDSIIEKVHHSDMGHYAIAYLCYKIATPLRYAVTLGGTTVSIKMLVQAGQIKPMPTKTEFMAMIEKKKADRVQAKLENAAETRKKNTK